MENQYLVIVEDTINSDIHIGLFTTLEKAKKAFNEQWIEYNASPDYTIVQWIKNKVNDKELSSIDGCRIFLKTCTINVVESLF